jgi:BRCT domain type II-containing protein
MLRKKANLLVKQAGGISQAKVSRTTDILVVGEQSPHWKAEEKGQKLLDLDHEGERGHRIAIMTEQRFENLIRVLTRR